MKIENGTIRQMTSGEKAALDAADAGRDWAEIRRRRNRLLADCDYTGAEDWPGDKAAWAQYRQALRDLPQTCATPGAVVWPTPPEA